MSPRLPASVTTNAVALQENGTNVKKKRKRRAARQRRQIYVVNFAAGKTLKKQR